ncbi:MAG: hypothetical protein HKN43_00505 [Rhodothermales bacterium]|nr:hypothetical protein [Rhodothermales bacterium]
MQSKTVFFFAILLTVSGVSRAQSSDEYKVVSVLTNWPAAVVEVDGTTLGPAMQESFLVAAESNTLRLLPPSGGAWTIPPIETAIGGATGDTIVVRVDFPYYYKFESAPYDAKIVLANSANGTLLGMTPFVLETDRPLVNDVELQLQGFGTERIRPGDDIWNRYLVELTPLDANRVRGEMNWTGSKRRRWWIDAAALTTAVTAGAIAVHYKFKADNRFDEFQRTGNPDLRPRIERFDDYSAVSLGVMQAGIGLFAIRLVLR